MQLSAAQFNAKDRSGIYITTDEIVWGRGQLQSYASKKIFRVDGVSFYRPLLNQSQLKGMESEKRLQKKATQMFCLFVYFVTYWRLNRTRQNPVSHHLTAFLAV